MKFQLKTDTTWCGTSFIRAVALLVTLGSITTATSLVGKDHEDKDKNRDPQTPVQNRERDVRLDENDDLNVKTDAGNFIRQVVHSGMKEIRIANLAKQRATSQEVKQFAEKLVKDHTKGNDKLKLIAQHENISLAGVLDPLGSVDTTNPTPDRGTTPAATRGDRDAGSIDTSASTTTKNERDTIRSAERPPGEARETAQGSRVLDPPGSVASSPVNSTTDRQITPAAVNGTARGAYAAKDVDSRADSQPDPYERLVGLTGKSFDEAYLNHEVQCHTKTVAKFEKASSDLPQGELKQFVESALPKLREHLALATRMAPADATRINVRERTNSDYKKEQAK